MTLAHDQLGQVWSNPDTFATVLLVLLADQYGPEAYGGDPEKGNDPWTAETILMHVEEDFGVTMPQGNLDKLMVAIDLLTSDNFYQSMPDFVNWCNVLSGDTYDPNTWDPADSSEIAWGITEAFIIEPPQEEDPFSDEICAYIGAVLDSEGMMRPPDVLRLAKRDVMDLTGQVSAEFSDDPEMYSSIYGLEASKTDDVNNYVKANIAALGHQLEQLPLTEGETKGIVERMLSVGKAAPS